MIKLVVFDLDGTVADTLEDLAVSVNHALSDQGLPTYPVDDYRHFVGNGADNLIRTVLADRYTDERFDAVKSRFQTYYAAHSRDCTKAYPGVAQLLGELRRRGIRTAVISNKPDAFVPGILSALYPEHHFDLVWGQQERFPRKPAPDALTAAIAALGADREHTLYVGDSDVDVAFAHAAGVSVCGVEWGFRGREELTRAGADEMAADADALLSIITEGCHEPA